MITDQQILNMLEMQDKANSAVNKKWQEAGNDWGLAIMAECIELADQVGWKWWKDQPTATLTQIHLEVVDIWHFLLSAIIERGDEAVLRMRLAAEPDVWLQDRSLVPSEVVARAKGMSVAAGLPYPHIGKPLNAFFMLMRAARLSTEELYRLYVGKVVLNLFRQANGYKQGTYVKQWAGAEDNVHLERLIERYPTASVRRLTSLLERTYREKALA